MLADSGSGSARMALMDPVELHLSVKRTTLRIPYTRFLEIAYGQKVDRRIMPAVLISPLFLLSKKRAHFLTLNFSDEQGRTQALVVRMEKQDVRAIIAGLEARTGLRVQFTDDDARRLGGY